MGICALEKKLILLVKKAIKTLFCQTLPEQLNSVRCVDMYHHTCIIKMYSLVNPLKT